MEAEQGGSLSLPLEAVEAKLERVGGKGASLAKLAGEGS